VFTSQEWRGKQEASGFPKARLLVVNIVVAEIRIVITLFKEEDSQGNLRLSKYSQTGGRLSARRSMCLSKD